MVGPFKMPSSAEAEEDKRRKVRGSATRTRQLREISRALAAASWHEHRLISITSPP
ncbi:hypothetical protein N8152_02295 [bacterium]|nr:hypothetical protein [bacterium]